MKEFLKLQLEANDGLIGISFTFENIEQAFEAIKDGKLSSIENVDESEIDVYFSCFIDGFKNDGLLCNLDELNNVSLEDLKEWIKL